MPIVIALILGFTLGAVAMFVFMLWMLDAAQVRIEIRDRKVEAFSTAPEVDEIPDERKSPARLDFDEAFRAGGLDAAWGSANDSASALLDLAEQDVPRGPVLDSERMNATTQELSPLNPGQAVSGKHAAPEE